MNTKHKLKTSAPAIVLTIGLALYGLETAAWSQDLYAPKPPVPDGYRLVEGDILVPITIEPDVWVPAATTYSTALWPDGVVPYEWDDNVNAANQQSMLAAMSVWQNVANITFRPRTFVDLFYVHIQNSTGNSSAVGRQTSPPWGAQTTVNIVSWGSTYIMAHELAHALGFWHEQSRSDRDSYVQINWDNIEDGKEHNFERHDEANHYGPYDFDSVMHYGQNAFSANGLPTITVLPPNDVQWQNAIGQRNHLSYWDARIMSFLYPYDNWRFADSTSSPWGTGTFFHPFNRLSSAVSSVPSGGTIWFEPGTYPAVGTYGKPMTWRSALGGVRLQ